jgi:hypothetical protein
MKEIDPHQAVDFLYNTAPLYAEAKGQRVQLEEFRKSKKAMLMKSSGVEAIGAQEREAYAHPEYVELLDGLRQAVVNEETLRWQLEAAKARIAIYQTMSANNRAIDRGTS